MNYGYGLRILREKIKDPMLTPNKYNNYITTVVKATFRTLENTMKLIGKKIRSINSHEEKMLRAPLINC